VRRSWSVVDGWCAYILIHVKLELMLMVSIGVEKVRR